MKKIAIRVRLLLSVIILSAASLVMAGDLNAPAGPTDSGSAMFTLEDLYNRLNTGAAGVKRSGPFAEPSASPGSTMHNLNDIMNKAPVLDNTAGAGTEHVISGKTYWGLQSGKWGLQTGTLSNIGAMNITPSAAEQTITAGFHDGTGKVAGDADLTAGNIRAGVNLFGVDGNSAVVNTASANATAGELLFNRTAWVNGQEITGTLANIGAMNITPSVAEQTISAGFHDGTGKVVGDADLIAGNIRAGINIFGVDGNSAVVNTSSANATAGELLFDRTAWVNGQVITGTRVGGVTLKAGGTFSPERRWYDNADGTITDVTTGLVWLKTLSTVERAHVATPSTPMDSIRYVGNLKNGTAGLTDGSRFNDWRVPTIREMQSLMTGPEAIGGGNLRGFSASTAFVYWTMSQSPTYYKDVSTINIVTGEVTSTIKTAIGLDTIWGLVWPVRGALLP
ncbi:MAG: DUF1566 domain-containing protein [Candidatus Riflebacteria bacterium]